MTDSLRVLIVDDHRLFLEGMQFLLRGLGKVDTVAVDSVAAGLRALDSNQSFDLIMLDLSLPTLSGLNMMESLVQRAIVVPVIIVSSTYEIAQIRRALSLGASGFIHKNASSKDMLDSIQRVLRGEIALPDSLSGQLDIAIKPGAVKTEILPAESPTIGDRQIEVLRLIEQGLSNKEIARILSITEATVKYHIGILFKDLGARNRTACLALARERGLLIDTD